MSDLIERLDRYAESVAGNSELVCGQNMLRLALGEAAAALRASAERERVMREALDEIDGAHIPDCPAHFAGDELEWAQRHVARLRQIARAALNLSRPEQPGEREA
jgi:hypothetical protein